ncbi:MAG: hypothetical protein ACT4O1_04645 [Gemmatimonadota bacterium]
MNTIDCIRACELMIEADLTELDGSKVSSLSQHIAQCSSCHAHAQRVLQGYAQLDAGLRALKPTGQARRRARARWLPWAPVPLAAAAVLALLLARGTEPPVRPSPLLLSLMFPETPVVTPPADKQALVIERNDMTVVWLY